MSHRSWQEPAGWVSDLDGVLVKGDHPLPGAVELIERWNLSATPYVVLTNNSTRTASALSSHLRGLGFTIPSTRIITAAEATAAYVASRGLKDAFVIGDAGIHEALHAFGVSVVEHSPSAVVIADTRTYSYDAIASAARHVLEGAVFIAASPDAYDPTPSGRAPSTGALCALITAVTDIEPECVGKPAEPMFRDALTLLGLPPQRTAMIGDRVDTDMRGAQRLGLRTVLVREDATDEPVHPEPDRIIRGVAELLGP